MTTLAPGARVTDAWLDGAGWVLPGRAGVLWLWPTGRTAILRGEHPTLSPTQPTPCLPLYVSENERTLVVRDALGGYVTLEDWLSGEYNSLSAAAALRKYGALRPVPGTGAFI